MVAMQSITQLLLYVRHLLLHLRNLLNCKNYYKKLFKEFITHRTQLWEKILFWCFSALTIFLGFALILYLIWPHIFNILFSANDTQSRSSLPFVTEYFIDQEKYLYWILLHANVALLIGAAVILATGTILLFYQQHACGMFRIAK